MYVSNVCAYECVSENELASVTVIYNSGLAVSVKVGLSECSSYLISRFLVGLPSPDMSIGEARIL